MAISGFEGLESLLMKVGTLPAAMERAGVVDESADLTVEMIHKKFGHQQPDWPPLTAETQAQRVRQGYPADEELLRSGGLRESYKKFASSGNEATVGVSPDDPHYEQAMTQEHGSISGSIPPRSVLEGIADRVAPEFIGRVRIVANDELSR